MAERALEVAGSNRAATSSLHIAVLLHKLYISVRGREGSRDRRFQSSCDLELAYSCFICEQLEVAGSNHKSQIKQLYATSSDWNLRPIAVRRALEVAGSNHSRSQVAYSCFICAYRCFIANFAVSHWQFICI